MKRGFCEGGKVQKTLPKRILSSLANFAKFTFFFMDKKTYFNNLHETLAEKYGVNKNWIGYLRQKRINLFRTQNQIIERLQEKLIRVLDEHDQEGIAICRKKLDFVKNLTYAQFEEITRKTEYDK